MGTGMPRSICLDELFMKTSKFQKLVGAKRTTVALGTAIADIPRQATAAGYRQLLLLPPHRRKPV